MSNLQQQQKQVSGNALLGKFETYLIGQDKKEAAVRLASIRTGQEYDAKSVEILFGVLKADQGDYGLPSSAFSTNDKLVLNDFCAKNGIPHHFDIGDDAKELDFNGIDFLTFDVKKTTKKVVDEDITVVKNAYGEWVAKDAKTGKVIEASDKKEKTSIKDTPVGKNSRVEKTTANPHKAKTAVSETTTEKAKKEYDKGIKKYTPKEEFKLNMTLLGTALGVLLAVFKKLGYTADVQQGEIYLLENNKTPIMNKIRRCRMIGEYFKINQIAFENVDLEVYVLDDKLGWMFMTTKDYLIIIDNNFNNEDGKMNIIWSGAIQAQRMAEDFMKYINTFNKMGGHIPGNTGWR